MKTILENLLDLPTRYRSKVAVRFYKHATWIDWTWATFAQNIDHLTSSLMNLNLPKETRVAIFSNTRAEWSVADWAILSNRYVTVPIYHNSLPAEVKHILNHSEAQVLFIENRACFKVWNQIKNDCPNIKTIIAFDYDESMTDQAIPFQDFLVEGAQSFPDHESKIIGNRKNAKPDDWATLVYTSGTTGLPKGVVINHRQIQSEVVESFHSCGVTDEDTTLSFLPYAHVLGRVEHWAHIAFGYTMAYAQSIEKLRSDLKVIRPTIMVAVPRIFEKIHGLILSQIQSHPLVTKLFSVGLKLGRDIAKKKISYEPIDLKSGIVYTILQKTIFKQVKDAFGGRLRFAVSGGAPLDPQISEFFYSCGILILEGYGLTETTAAVTVNTPFKFKFGTVGSPIGEVQVKIADDGEIFIKSDKVMPGYYKDDAATKEVLHNGWFATGDIGQILSSGEIKITDRKKDLIKTAGGKYVAPQRLENLLKLSPIVSQVLIHGDQKKFIVALITLDRVHLKEWAKRNAVGFQNWVDLLKQPQVEKLVREVVAETNSQLASFETIKRFTILPDEFTVEGGQLTPSLKVKRKVLDKLYQEQITALYK